MGLTQQSGASPSPAIRPSTHLTEEQQAEVEHSLEWPLPELLTDALTVEQHAHNVQRSIQHVEVWSQHIAATKRQLDAIEREARTGIEGRNQQERDDRLADVLQFDKAYQDTLASLDGYRTRRAAAEGELEYHQLMARYKIALVVAQGSL